MNENPAGQGPAPEEPEQGSKPQGQPLSTQLDPDFVPDQDSSTPEEKIAREKPEETGS